MNLVVVETGKKVGRVYIGEDGQPVFQGWAARVFRIERERLGDAWAAKILMEEGWSNGYLALRR